MGAIFFDELHEQNLQSALALTLDVFASLRLAFIPGAREIDQLRERLAGLTTATGLTRLVTEPIPQASADQRAGRAGRLGPGVCYRLWTPARDVGRPAHRPPEILQSDLAGLALELALWGIKDPADLRWLQALPHPAWEQAIALLLNLRALDEGGHISPSAAPWPGCRFIRALPPCYWGRLAAWRRAMAPPHNCNAWSRGWSEFPGPGSSPRGASLPLSIPTVSPSDATTARAAIAWPRERAPFSAPTTPWLAKPTW